MGRVGKKVGRIGVGRVDSRASCLVFNSCLWWFHMLFALRVSKVFDTFKPITVERLMVHTRGLRTRFLCCFFSFFCGSSLYFLIVRKWYIWLNGLLLSDVSDIDFVLHMWNRVTLQEFWNQVIYQLFKHTCALLMKLPIFTCLKLFASNTLFTSCLRILNISTFFCFWFEIY